MLLSVIYKYVDSKKGTNVYLHFVKRV